MIVGEAPRFARADEAELLSAGLAFAAVSLLSASSAVRQLMVALNVAYRRREHRSWLRRRVIAAAFAGEIGLLARTGLFDASAEGRGEVVELALKWAINFLISVVALTLLYRYAPARRLARWRWVTPGSVFAALAGIATSVGASVYLREVARYEHTYGGLGALLGLAVWLWTAMMTVLAGAELNFAIEAQTSADTCAPGDDLGAVGAAG